MNIRALENPSYLVYNERYDWYGVAVRKRSLNHTSTCSYDIMRYDWYGVAVRKRS